MADKLADHLKLEAKRKDKKMTTSNLKQSKSSKGTKKKGNHTSSKPRPESHHHPTAEEAELLKPLTFLRGGGICSGPPEICTITGLSAAGARMMGLSSSQLGKIKREFIKMDVDKSGEISMSEFIEFIDGIESDFVKEVCHRMIFGFTDLDGDGSLSFNEFVLGCILLSTFSKDQIMYIMFEMFDNNGNHYVEKSEFGHLAKSVDELAGNLFPGNYQSFCHSFDTDGDGLISFDEFMHINDAFPMIFFPPLRMQDVMRKTTLGYSTWRSLTAKFDKKTAATVKKRNKIAQKQIVPEEAINNGASSGGGGSKDGSIDNGTIDTKKSKDSDSDGGGGGGGGSIDMNQIESIAIDNNKSKHSNSGSNNNNNNNSSRSVDGVGVGKSHDALSPFNKTNKKHKKKDHHGSAKASPKSNSSSTATSFDSLGPIGYETPRSFYEQIIILSTKKGAVKKKKKSSGNFFH